jgi:hypothetical protein
MCLQQRPNSCVITLVHGALNNPVRNRLASPIAADLVNSTGGLRHQSCGARRA